MIGFEVIAFLLPYQLVLAGIMSGLSIRVSSRRSVAPEQFVAEPASVKVNT